MNANSLNEIRLELSRLSGIDFTSLTAVRQELERRGGNTSTPGIRGDARRETLEVRLKQILEKQGVPLYIQPKTSDEGRSEAATNKAPTTVDPAAVNWGSLMSIKTALDRLHVSTQTTGLKGDERRAALAERLQSTLSIQNSMQAMNGNSGSGPGTHLSATSTALAGQRGDNSAAVSVAAPAVPKLDLGLFKVPVAPYRGEGFGPRPPPLGPSAKTTLQVSPVQTNAGGGYSKQKKRPTQTSSFGGNTYKAQVQALEKALERSRQKVKDLAARRAAWIEEELGGNAESEICKARMQLQVFKKELHRVRHHKRRFIDSAILTGDAHRYATSVLQHRLKEQIEPLQAYVTEQTDVIRDEADDHPQLGVKAERVLRDEVAALVEELDELKEANRLENIAKIVAGNPTPSLDDSNAKAPSPFKHFNEALERNKHGRQAPPGPSGNGPQQRSLLHVKIGGPSSSGARVLPQSPIQTDAKKRHRLSVNTVLAKDSSDERSEKHGDDQGDPSQQTPPVDLLAQNGMFASPTAAKYLSAPTGSKILVKSADGSVVSKPPPPPAATAPPSQLDLIGLHAMEIYFRKRNTENAVELLERALDSEPSHCANLRWRGDLHRYMAEDAAAEAVYHKALEAFSQKRNGPRKLHIAILFGLAEATSALQKLEVAAQYYSRVVDAVPDHSKAVAALAQLEFKLNLRARATSSNTNGAAANTSTSIESKEMVHVNSTGKLEIHRRRPTLSLSAVEQLFLRALECNPNDTQNLINFAQFMRTARNNHDGAKNLLYKATLLQPCNGGILGNYAAILSKCGEMSRAQLYYQRGVVFDPTNVNCMGNFASFCFRVNNDVEKANALFTQALKQQPDHVNNLCKYATFLSKTTANARAHAKKFLEQQEAIGLAPSSVDRRGKLRGETNAADDEKRQIDDAIEALLTRACALEPFNATALSNYANFLKKIRQDHVRAREFYVRAIKAEPSHKMAQRNYAVFLRDFPEHRQGTQRIVGALRRRTTETISM